METLQKTTFVDLPNTTTPVDADFLNDLQDNIINNFSEVDTRLTSNSSSIGTLSSLTTTEKSNLVSATNEVNGKLGNLSNLNTTNKNNLVDSINEVNGKIENNNNDGWYILSIDPTLTYANYDSSVNTGVVSTSLDLTSYLSLGMKVKFNQDGATKYAFITKITNSQLTLYMGNDYSLSNSTISNFYYSMLKAPYGFPLKRESWDIIKTITTTTGENNPSKGSYYQLENMTITVPIGEWEVGWQANIYPQRTGTGTNEQQSGLSTSLTEPSNPELFATIFTTGNTTQNMANMGRNSNYYFDSKKTFYFLARTTQANMTYIGIYANNSYGHASLYAKCQYL